MVFLIGSDVVWGLVHWPNVRQLLKSSGVIVGIREQDNMEQVQQVIERWPVIPSEVTLLKSYAPNVSSAAIREALRTRRPAAGILKSVARYSDHHWLYVSVA